jgi:hypothetical protein
MPYETISMRSSVFVALLLAAPALAQKVNPKATGWHSDYTTAKAEAKRTGKPLFVAFRCEP